MLKEVKEGMFIAKESKPEVAFKVITLNHEEVKNLVYAIANEGKRSVCELTAPLTYVKKAYIEVPEPKRSTKKTASGLSKEERAVKKAESEAAIVKRLVKILTEYGYTETEGRKEGYHVSKNARVQVKRLTGLSFEVYGKEDTIGIYLNGGQAKLLKDSIGADNVIVLSENLIGRYDTHIEVSIDYESKAIKALLDNTKPVRRSSDSGNVTEYVPEEESEDSEK